MFQYGQEIPLEDVPKSTELDNEIMHQQSNDERAIEPMYTYGIEIPLDQIK